MCKTIEKKPGDKYSTEKSTKLGNLSGATTCKEIFHRKRESRKSSALWSMYSWIWINKKWQCIESKRKVKEVRGGGGSTNHCPIIFLFMLNTHCTSVDLISFFMAISFGRENGAAPESMHVIFNATHTMSRVKHSWTGTSRFWLDTKLSVIASDLDTRQQSSRVNI